MKGCTSLNHRTKEAVLRPQEGNRKVYLSQPKFLSENLFFEFVPYRNVGFKFILLSKFSRFRNPHTEKLTSMCFGTNNNLGAFVRHKDSTVYAYAS